MGKNRGLTLIELLVTLAVLVTMVTLGVPQLKNLINSNRRTTQVNDLVIALNLARSEAAKRATIITVCASNPTNTDCLGTDWENGWFVFDDANSDGVIDAGETLRAFGAITGGTLATAGAAIAVIDYQPDGRPVGGGVTFERCDDYKNSSDRSIVVGATGIVHTTNIAPGCPVTG